MTPFTLNFFLEDDLNLDLNAKTDLNSATIDLDSSVDLAGDPWADRRLRGEERGSDIVSEVGMSFSLESSMYDRD